MKKKLTLTNLCMNLMARTVQPNAESSLYAEVQPVLAYRRQSYAIFRPVANFLAFISSTCSDTRPYRLQIRQTSSKSVMSKRLLYLFSQNLP